MASPSLHDADAESIGCPAPSSFSSSSSSSSSPVSHRLCSPISQSRVDSSMHVADIAQVHLTQGPDTPRTRNSLTRDDAMHAATNVPYSEIHDDQENIHHLRTFLPEDLESQSEAPHVSVGHEAYVVKACQCDFEPLDHPPPGWAQLTHPGGRSYFWHQASRVLTPEWMPDGCVANCVETVADYILDRYERYHGTRDLGDRQIVIGLDEFWISGSIHYAALYYLVDPEKECVFWLEDKSLAYELSWVNRDDHIEPHLLGTYLRYQFYIHWDIFPNVQKVTALRIFQWRKVINEARTAVVFSDSATTPYTEEQLTSMLEMVECMESQGEAAERLQLPLEGDWLPGRMMPAFYLSRLIHLYGQRGARLDAHQSGAQQYEPFGTTQSVSIRICGLFLFQAPQRHISNLKYTFDDGILARGPWKKYTGTLMSEWSSHRLVASLLLAADVALLSVDSFPDGIARIACFLSAISSSAIFVLITALEGRLQQINQWSVEYAEHWLRSLHNEHNGLEILAITLGLSHGLTLWSMIFFTVSLLSYCMQDAQFATVIIVAIYFACHILILCWATWASRDNDQTLSALWDYKRRSQRILKIGATTIGIKITKHAQKLNKARTRMARWSTDIRRGSRRAAARVDESDGSFALRPSRSEADEMA